MAQDRWQEVRTKVEGLALKLRLHLEQEQGEVEPEAARNDTRAALQEMGTKLQDAVDSLNNAAKDPAIRADVKDLGALLRDVMDEALSTVGTEVGGILNKTKGEVAEARNAASDAVSDAGAAVEDATDTVTDTASDAVSDAGAAVEGATETVTDAASDAVTESDDDESTGS